MDGLTEEAEEECYDRMIERCKYVQLFGQK